MAKGYQSNRTERYSHQKYIFDIYIYTYILLETTSRSSAFLLIKALSERPIRQQKRSSKPNHQFVNTCSKPERNHRCSPEVLLGSSASVTTPAAVSVGLTSTTLEALTRRFRSRFNSCSVSMSCACTNNRILLSRRTAVQFNRSVNRDLMPWFML